jgi:DNA (cytosine-5)-methyltransferase 1
MNAGSSREAPHSGRSSGRPTFIDLFCGAGGMGLGFMQAGFQPLLAIDNDVYSIQTHEANFPGESICMDIREVEKFPAADIVIGGPPCQGFSRLGKKVRRKREENLLWREYMRCVEQAQPLVFVVENVPEFFDDAAFDGISERAAELGYKMVHGVLNAADYGVPQRRRRAIMIGSRLSEPSLPEASHSAGEFSLFTGSKPAWRTVRDAIGDLPLEPTNTNLHNSRNVTELSRQRYRHIPPGGNRKDLPPHLQPDCWRYKDPRGGGSTDLMGRLTWDAPSLTIRTEFLKPEKGRYLHPEADRSLTVREGARLQTFPDSFRFEGSTFQIAKQIGNAVPVELARKIALSVTEHMAGNARDTDIAS